MRRGCAHLLHRTRQSAINLNMSNLSHSITRCDRVLPAPWLDVLEIHTHFCAASSGARPPAPSSVPRRRPRHAARQPLRCAARAAPLCSQPGPAARRAAARSALPRRAGAAVPRAAAGLGKGRAARPRRAGWPWSSALRWQCVDRWRAGARQWQALRRQGPGACVALKWCAGGVRCRQVATLHQAPSGSGAQGRERRAALSSVALSPRGVQGVGPARRRARPTRQATRRSPACQRGQRNGQGSWPGCQFRLCRVASHC